MIFGLKTAKLILIFENLILEGKRFACLFLYVNIADIHRHLFRKRQIAKDGDCKIVNLVK